MQNIESMKELEHISFKIVLVVVLVMVCRNNHIE